MTEFTPAIIAITGVVFGGFLGAIAQQIRIDLLNNAKRRLSESIRDKDLLYNELLAARNILEREFSVVCQELRDIHEQRHSATLKGWETRRKNEAKSQ